MRKGKIAIGVIASILALGGALATNTRTAIPGNLYYFVSGDCGDFCAQAPCATYNEIGVPCEVGQTYLDEQCLNLYPDQAWVRDGGN